MTLAQSIYLAALAQLAIPAHREALASDLAIRILTYGARTLPDSPAAVDGRADYAQSLRLAIVRPVIH